MFGMVFLCEIDETSAPSCLHEWAFADRSSAWEYACIAWRVWGNVRKDMFGDEIVEKSD